MGELWDLSFAACTLILPCALLVSRTQASPQRLGPVTPSRGSNPPLNGDVQNLRELGRGFMARTDRRLLHPLPRMRTQTFSLFQREE